MKLRKGTQVCTAFAKYITNSLIGQGGTGKVYRVLDENNGAYAIKVLDSQQVTQDKRKRFKNELSFGLMNQHPNTITILDHGLIQSKNSETPFYVMPFYDSSLRELIRNRVSSKEVLSYFAQVLDGVEAAHLKSIIHRDLKPENILMDSKLGKLLIADFGIAHFMEEDLYTVVETLPNQRLANFQYASPEQKNRGSSVDMRADIFALGLMLNEMFTGEVPHGTGYKTISSVTPEHSYLDDIVAHMIRQSPSERPASIEAIKKMLIARGIEFVSQQRLSKLSKVVIPKGEIDDPLILDPVRIVEVDYRNGHLILRFQHPINEKWIQALHSMESYQSILGKEPNRFSFTNDKASIGARENECSQIVFDFKVWLHKANHKYKEMIQREIKQGEDQERRSLQAKIDEEKKRLRILKSIQI